VRRSETGAGTQAREGSRGGFTPPSRVAVTSAPGGPREPGSGMAVRNWRVRTRLYAILLIPVVIGLVFGGFRVQDSVTTWDKAKDAQRTAELVRAAATYGNALLDERDRSAGPLLAGRRNDPAVQRARNLTDEAKKDFDRAAARMPDKPGLKRRLAVFRKQEPKLGPLRVAAYTKRLNGVQTEEGYVGIQHPLMEFANELGFGTGNITSYGRTVYSVSLGKAAQSLERSIGMHLLAGPEPGKPGKKDDDKGEKEGKGAGKDDKKDGKGEKGAKKDQEKAQEKDQQRQFAALTSYAYLERIAVEEYTGGGRPQDVALLKRERATAEAETEKRLDEAKAAAEDADKDYVDPLSTEDAITAITSGASKKELKAKGITPESWFTVSTGEFDAYRAVEKQLTERAVDETEEISADAGRDALVNAAIVLASVLLAFLVAAMMARSMSRGMRDLRTAALTVAQQRLPKLVDRLSRTEPGRIDTRVTPIPIDSSDEIGEVARAFDQVHREAVRLAAEQALLRGNVKAIFTNLSSRNQGLIERQLGLISELENNEADPDQLENLFRLDHLATRMRRNGENLLVLAGEEPGRRWNEPMPLIDILRAASSEVEHYERIELSGISETEIHGHAVNDLVHLLAELLENATTFSAPRSAVMVTATRLPDERVAVEIHDRGIGLTRDDFADINEKLANPPTVDASLARRMGLFVVGRLAERHGIHVQLRPAVEQSGTTCLVTLPGSITRGGGGEEESYEDFRVSRIVPELPQPPQMPALDSRSAAAFGFDDSRYASQNNGGYGVPGNGGYGVPGNGGYGTPDEPYAPAPPGRSLPGPGPRRELEAGPSTPDEGQRLFQVPPHNGQYSVQGPEAESGTGVHGNGWDRVGFDRSGPTMSSYHSVTGAGLPRREIERSPLEQGQDEQYQQYEPQPESEDRRSANDDERWSRADRPREPQAGGITSSGLPRRVPRANLAEGTGETHSRGGPSVSRAPEDVRGRLSNLHRGVRSGRHAGDASQNDREGYGPGSTYDQER
jgi:signal transduction histidine kinase